MKIHLKLKNKPLCGQKKQKSKFRYAEKQAEVTCKRCLKCIER